MTGRGIQRDVALLMIVFMAPPRDGLG
jgi:hypothetical protein